MSNPFFFGYGSLVNQLTHDYPQAQAATLHNWRRAWVRTARRDVVFLTAVPARGHQIDGLIAAVPGADWGALDLREHGYQRIASHSDIVHDLAPATQVAHYAVHADHMRKGGDHVILLSYLDVVIQGYLREFGKAGVQAFFDSTDGWDVPIRNDRMQPVYPRAQTLSAQETALVDHHVQRVGARIA